MKLGRGLSEGSGSVLITEPASEQVLGTCLLLESNGYTGFASFLLICLRLSEYVLGYLLIFSTFITFGGPKKRQLLNY